MKRTILLAATAVILSSGLGGCDSVKSALGLQRQSPDEYQVVENPPLTMPPDYGLRAPTSPSEKPPGESTEQAARETVFRSPDAVPPAGKKGATESNGLTPGENALLGQAGAQSVDPAIRSRLDAEATTDKTSNDGFVDRLLFWKTGTRGGDALDPAQEAQRLQQNAANGQPANAGAATPTIQRKNRSIFDVLF